MTAPADAFTLTDEGIVWDGGVVARLGQGPTLLEPTVRTTRLDLLSPSQIQRVQRRVAAAARDLVESLLDPLRGEELRGPAQGLTWALSQGLGVVLAAEVADLVRALPPRDRGTLARLGVRLGVEHVWCTPMLANARAHAILWRAMRGDDRSPGYWRAIGTPMVGGVAVPVDVLEEFAARAREGARHGAFPAPEILGEEDRPKVLLGLGYQRAGDRWVRGRRAGR